MDDKIQAALQRSQSLQASGPATGAPMPQSQVQRLPSAAAAELAVDKELREHALRKPTLSTIYGLADHHWEDQEFMITRLATMSGGQMTDNQKPPQGEQKPLQGNYPVHAPPLLASLFHRRNEHRTDLPWLVRKSSNFRPKPDSPPRHIQMT